jgi:hypothetical protein
MSGMGRLLPERDGCIRLLGPTRTAALSRRVHHIEIGDRASSMA